ncbi:MAG: FHA domain-containing protein [Alphaproteobacteria bacterium]|nr:FHA domain-containing protein [Alphaproteobacteria bacterium]MCB9794364.1 FHA domain-containing protein [Alphaproteobacteria bacterium]
MALLAPPSGAAAQALPAQCLVGRSPQALLHIPDSRVSWDHARLRWTGRAWELRDLGSRNGTYVDGQRLDAGQVVELGLGQRVSFGDPQHAWRVVELAPPAVCARPVAGGPCVFGDAQLLALPSEAAPRAFVALDARGRWVVEQDEGGQVVEDEAVIQVEGEAWLLLLPTAVTPTWNPKPTTPDLLTLRHRFSVSRDEEHVEWAVSWEGGPLVSTTSVFNYLLLTLARHRLADIEEGQPPEEQGWVYREDLCRMLALDLGLLNLYVFRARKVLSEAGVAGAASLVERRSLTGQLRLGTDLVEVLAS